MRILFVCMGNTCRSIMAEGFLKAIDARLEVFSAGINPENKVNHFAVEVMMEKGIDISAHVPQHINKYQNFSFDYLITLCDFARGQCPDFNGKIHQRLHRGFTDPANTVGTEKENFYVYRKVRDEIENFVIAFYSEKLRNRSLVIFL